MEGIYLIAYAWYQEAEIKNGVLFLWLKLLFEDIDGFRVFESFVSQTVLLICTKKWSISVRAYLDVWKEVRKICGKWVAKDDFYASEVAVSWYPT